MKSLQSDCGKNFLTALVDGKLTVDFADKKATYTVNGKPFYYDAGSSTQVMGLFVWKKSRSVFVKGEGLVYFFCHDRHPRTDFLGRIRGDENDGKIENIGFISIFALELAFLDRKMKVA